MKWIMGNFAMKRKYIPWVQTLIQRHPNGLEKKGMGVAKIQHPLYRLVHCPFDHIVHTIFTNLGVENTTLTLIIGKNYNKFNWLLVAWLSDLVLPRLISIYCNGIFQNSVSEKIYSWRSF